MNQLFILLAAVALVVVTELVLWLFFRRRVRGFLFPREADISTIRFFTLPRIYACAAVHTVFLLLVAVLSLWLLW